MHIMEASPHMSSAPSTASSHRRQSTTAPALNATERRRIQNRDAQRRFRNKKSANASAASSQNAGTSVAQDTAAQNHGVPLRPRLLPGPASPALPQLLVDTMNLYESRPQSRALDVMEGVPQSSSLLDDAYADDLMSASKSNARMSRLYETFTRYFGPIADAAGAPLAFTPQPDINPPESSMPPTPPIGVQDHMQSWANHSSSAEGHFFPSSGMGVRSHRPQNDSGETNRSSKRRARKKPSDITPPSPALDHSGSSSSNGGVQSAPTKSITATPTSATRPRPFRLQMRSLPGSEPTSGSLTTQSGMETSSGEEEDGTDSPSGLSTDGGGGGSVGREQSFQTTLHIAAEHSHEAILNLILAGGSTGVDERDSEGNTALHVAVRRGGKLRVVDCLLRYGADPNAENTAGWTPIHLAVSIGSMDMVEALVRHGGDLGRTARMRR